MAADPISEVRRGAALIVDIAGTVGLRARIGDTDASPRIRRLLDAIIAESRKQGGEFIKSYGDDVLAIFERDPVESAARVAIRAQQLAQAAGLQLYAGFHYGDIEFRHTMGHPDAIGLTVNIAARLHKLTEGAPGRIFFAEDALAALPESLRAQSSLYGTRDLKGIGPMVVWTLDWFTDTATTVIAPPGGGAASVITNLALTHGESTVQLGEVHRSGLLGRGKDCTLRVVDPKLLVSSSHVMLEQNAGRWFVQDISRNGTWMRDAKSGEVSQLPKGKAVPLPPEGAFCLGRAFDQDADGAFTVAFKPAE